MVFQHFSLFDNLTVAENISLGLSSDIATPELKTRVRDLGEKYRLALDPDAHIADLSMGERQRDEIVRCLLQDPKLHNLSDAALRALFDETQDLFEELPCGSWACGIALANLWIIVSMIDRRCNSVAFGSPS